MEATVEFIDLVQKALFQTAFNAELMIGMWLDALSEVGGISRSLKDRNGPGAGKHGIVAVDKARQKLVDLGEGDYKQAQSSYQQKEESARYRKKPVADEVVFDVDTEAA